MKNAMIAQLSLEDMAAEVERLENDEHVLLARKYREAQEFISQKYNALVEEHNFGVSLENDGITEETIDKTMREIGREWDSVYGDYGYDY